MTTSATEKFINDHSKLNEAGDVRSLTQESYFGFMEQHQLTPQVLKSVTAAEEQLVTGMITVATHDLSKKIAEAKKNGDDPTELSSSVRISRPSGQLATDVIAQRTTTNPRTGEKLTQNGVVTVKARTKGMIDGEAAKKTAETIGKLLA